MEPITISVVCPILKTDSDINVGMLKEFIEKLLCRDRKVYEIQQGFDVPKIAGIAREVVEKHDVRHIRTLRTKDDKEWEIWYYGRTKVQKDDIVLKVSITAEKSTLELFAATKNAEILTGLLAEIGRDLKHGIEFRASGKGNIINVTINDSVIQRSNLLDLCSTDGTCPPDTQMEGSAVQQSDLAPERKESGETEKIRKQREEQERLQRQKEEEARLKREETARNIEEIKKKSSEEAERKIPPFKPGTSSRKGILIFGLIFGVLLIGAVAIFSLMNNSNDTQKNVDSLQSVGSVQKAQQAPVTSPSENTGKAVLNTTAETNTTQTSSAQNSDTFNNSIGMEFVKVPAGEFTMGSPSDEAGRFENEGPVHKVTISKSFYLGKLEVTQEQWRKVMGSSTSGSKDDDLPAAWISWDDVQEFIKKLNEMEGTDKYRLPSEAEWEYACRAGTETRYYFGDDESVLGDYGWYSNISGGKAHPIGQKKPNQWGLYDINGNVWEWCQDNWHDSYNGAPADGSTWESGSSSSRVRRGGSWDSIIMKCRSAARNYAEPGFRRDFIGFRVLRTL